MWRREILLALFIGALSTLAFSPTGFSLLLPVTLAVWLDRIFKQRSGKMAAGLGFSFGLGFFLAGIAWIYISLHVYGGMPAPLTGLALFLFSSCLALYWLCAARLIWYFREKPALQLLIVPASLGLMDWLRGTLFTGFPWLSLGYSQIPTGWFHGFDPLLGIYGVSLIIGLAAALLRLVFVSGWSMKGLAGLGLLILVSLGINSINYTHAVGSPFSVRLIQGNIPQSIKWHPEEAIKTLEHYRTLIDESHERLVILPETAFPVFSNMLPKSFLSGIATYLRRNNSDLLYGVPEEADGRYYNSVMSLGVSPSQVYRKRHLVPFGEFVPLKFIFKPVMAWLNIPLDDFNRGSRKQPPILAAGQKIAVDVCYEDNFGNEIRRSLPQATVLVNVTDDAWFGHVYAASQHLQISEARALETGRYMLRATNTGITAIINEHGKLLSELPPGVTGALIGNVQGYEGMTPYARFGDILMLILSISMIGVAFIFRTRQ
ncbi:MAG TPA: apolipoprotein N-acyltransferase [Burkholderiales bacterium]|nr:apolipoprotein N-acyltransferase [Burkholderiales bacterium]